MFIVVAVVLLLLQTVFFVDVRAVPVCLFVLFVFVAIVLRWTCICHRVLLELKLNCC